MAVPSRPYLAVSGIRSFWRRPHHKRHKRKALECHNIDISQSAKPEGTVMHSACSVGSAGSGGGQGLPSLRHLVAALRVPFAKNTPVRNFGLEIEVVEDATLTCTLSQSVPIISHRPVPSRGRPLPFTIPLPFGTALGFDFDMAAMAADSFHTRQPAKPWLGVAWPASGVRVRTLHARHPSKNPALSQLPFRHETSDNV